MTFRTLRTPLTASALLLAAACADSTAAPDGALDAAVSADIAASSAASIASDVAVLGSNEGVSGVGFATGDTATGDQCSRTATTVTCSGGREGTRTVSRSFTLFDAAGATQARFDSLTTARIEFRTVASGSFTGPQASGTMQRERTMVLSGLAGRETQRQWDGTGSGTLTSQHVGDRGTRRYSTVESDTTTGVTRAVPATRGAFPLSGTVVRRVTATASVDGVAGTRVHTRRVTVTFNGTGRVPMTVSTTGPRRTADVTCTLDLAARTSTCGGR